MDITTAFEAVIGGSNPSEGTMKLLFVCRGNVGRSQMAAELYRAITGETALSAGTKVDDSAGQTIKDLPVGGPQMIACMNEIGIDISNNVRTQVTPELASLASHIIVMAEPDTVPDWLRTDPKTELWTVPDPKGTSAEGHTAIREEIRKLLIEYLSNA